MSCSEDDWWCCARVLQFASAVVLVFVNVVSCLLGIAILLCGIAFHSGSASLVLEIFGLHSQHDSFIQSFLNSQSTWITFLITGSIVILFSILIVMAMISRWRLWVSFYTAFIGLILAAVIACTVALSVVVQASSIAELSKECLQSNFDDVYFRSNASLSFSALAWNAFMIKYSCCGFDSFSEFESAKLWNRRYPPDVRRATVPVSCCQLDYEPNESFWRLYWGLATGILDVAPRIRSCLSDPTTEDSHYLVACSGNVTRVVKEWQYAGIVAGIATAGSVFAYFVACCILCVSYRACCNSYEPYHNGNDWIPAMQVQASDRSKMILRLPGGVEIRDSSATEL